LKGLLLRRGEKRREKKLGSRTPLNLTDEQLISRLPRKKYPEPFFELRVNQEEKERKVTSRRLFHKQNTENKRTRERVAGKPGFSDH